MSKPAIYRPNCSVCQYMKRNRDFRQRVMQSTYFNPEGTETVMDINLAFGAPFKRAMLYAHLKRHQSKDLIKAKPIVPAEVIMGVEANSMSTTEHEVALDEFIHEGRNKMARGELSITSQTLLQAIKTKADIEKNTKDRRMDMIKAFFLGDKNGQDEATSLPEGKS